MNICRCGYIKQKHQPACCIVCYKNNNGNHGPLCSRINKYIINKDDDYYFETSCSGIGDRMGQIVTICTFSKCFGLNNKLVIIWKNSEHRNYDLNVVKKYISFPSNCIITDDHSFMKNRTPLYLFDNIKIFGHSYDLIPEPSYLLLLENYTFEQSLSFRKYLSIYMNVASEITISDDILMGNVLPVCDYKCVHVRRDDKLVNSSQPFIPQNLNQYINTNENIPFLFISDDVVPDTITNKKNCHVFTLHNLTNLENVILDLYLLVNSNEIISVIYSDGWSSFSYVASRTKNTRLVSYVPPDSRYHNICKRTRLTKLYNWNIIYL